MSRVFTVTAFGEEWKLVIREKRYRTTDRLSIVFIEAGVGGGSTWGTLTVNMPDVHLNPGEVIVKLWSENQGFESLLQTDPDVFQDTGRRVSAGFVEACVWRYVSPLTASAESQEGVVNG